MAIQHSIDGHPTNAECDGATLVLEYFVEDDPAVLRVLSEADDVAEGAHTCMQVGARALLAGHAALDEVLVGRSFDQLVEKLNTSVNAGVGRITETATGLLGEEDGALTKVLTDLRAELSQRMGQLFDPESKTSALALLEEVFSAASARSTSQLQASLALDDEQSPLGRWRAEVTKVVRDQTDGILKEVREVASSLAVEEGRTELWEKTTLKGIAYQDVVHLAFAEVAAHHGDVIEDVGRQRGASGSQVGDLVMSLNPEEFSGESTSLVLEVKNRRLSLRKTLDELTVAMANREAKAGIAVFAKQEYAPTPSVFVNFGNRAILVLDGEAPDIGAVQLASAWGRWVARRAAEGDTSSFDSERFNEAIAKATRALDRASTIRKCHSTVRRQVDQAGSELTDMVTEAREAIGEIKELGGA
jgi:hypothetical protein